MKKVEATIYVVDEYCDQIRATTPKKLAKSNSIRVRYRVYFDTREAAEKHLIERAEQTLAQLESKIDLQRRCIAKLRKRFAVPPTPKEAP